MRYRKTPLAEAVFELFGEPTAWTEDSGPAFEAAFKGTYGGKRSRLRGIGLHVQMGPGVSLQQGVREQPERIQMWNAESTRMIQFASNMCAFNVLPPYTHYVDYLAEIRRLAEAFVDRAKPASLASIGQRYINRILLPPGAPPEKYFEIYPALPERVRKRHPPFSMQVVAKELELGGQVVLTLTAQGDDADRPVYILDAYAQSAPGLEPAWAAILAWHDEAHAAIKECFELSITDESRELFGRDDADDDGAMNASA